MDKITLYYFIIGDSVTIARGENIKLLLEDAGLEHEYVRTQRDVWAAEIKPRLTAQGAHSCTLPCIETGGQRFFKTIPIMRYISTKLGGKYHGSTPEENQILDVVSELNEIWYEIRRSVFFDQGLMDSYVKETVPAQISLFENYYSDREGPYILGEKISYVDFLIYHMIEDGMAREKLDGVAPHLVKLVEVFEQRPNIKKYLATLPQ